MKIKKIPQRMCLGCQESRPKKEWCGSCAAPRASSPWTSRARSWRGAYICHKRECFDKAKKSHGLERSFKSPIDAAVYDLLERELFEDKAEAESWRIPKKSASRTS